MRDENPAAFHPSMAMATKELMYVAFQWKLIAIVFIGCPLPKGIASNFS